MLQRSQGVYESKIRQHVRLVPPDSREIGGFGLNRELGRDCVYSEKDWGRWIDDYLRELKAVYDNSPKRIKEDYGNETKVSSDYKGRAILELLQNADDAQVPERQKTDKVGPPQVYFVLNKGVLYCGNGGYSMSMDGLDSICRLSHSPKEVKGKKRQTIGEKGLGFKSILSFSDTPEIHSEELHCFFSRKRSYEFISQTERFAEVSSGMTEKNVPLLRVPNRISSERWQKDKTLVDLLKTCATVIKLPLSEEARDREVREELEQIDSTILLFLRHLNALCVESGGRKVATYSIRRGKPRKLDESTSTTPCTIRSNGSETDWTVLQHYEDIPTEQLVGLGEEWEGMDVCCISFAILREQGSHIPLPPETRHKIRVYFPTNEDFHFPLMFHATFFTDISRKTINPKIPYNSFVVSESVKCFLNYVLPAIHSDSKVDPGQHLDILSPSIELGDLAEIEVDSVGKTFLLNLFKEAGKFSVIPKSDGSLSPIEGVRILDRDEEEWDDWYEILGETLQRNLSLIHLGCKKKNRIGLIRHLEPEIVSDEELVERLNEMQDELKTVEWCAKVYMLLKRLYDEASWVSDQRKSWEKLFGTLRVVKLSDDSVVCGEGEYKVFMPPTSPSIPLPPNWLKIKFVHPNLISLLQSRSGESRRDKIQAEYLDYFGVKQYRAREVVRECATKDLSPYWKGEDTEVNPKDLLFFLFDLQKDELKPDEVPEARMEKHLARIPVRSYDPKGNPGWSPAGRIYASSEWSGSPLLEELYSFDEKSRFLAEKEYFGEDEGKWEVFFRWLGISWSPRIIRMSSSMAHGRARKPTAQQKLRDWRRYSAVIEKTEYGDGEGTIDDGRIGIDEDYVIDRFFEICDDPTRQKLLLNYLAENPSFVDNIPKASISFLPKWKHYERTAKLDTNYQEWCLENSDWLYALNIAERSRPSELCIPTENLYGTLGDYANYVDHKTSQNSTDWAMMKSFLIRIGVKDSIEELPPSHWYSVLANIPKRIEAEKLNDADAQEIRGIYRRFIRSKVSIETEHDQKARNDFLESERVLCSMDGKHLFCEVSEAFYVDKLDLLAKFEKHVPCFQVEAKRSKRVMELFDIRPLSESIEMEPEFGAFVGEYSDAINSFFERSRQFLLARIRSQRSDRIDSARLSKTEMRPVRRILVKYGLTDDGGTNWIYNGEVDSLLFPNEDDSGWSIHLNARLIQNPIESSDDFAKEHMLIQEMADRVAELLDIDLSEAFQLILSRSDRERMAILRSNGINDEILNECRIEIDEAADIPMETEDETEIIPRTPREIPKEKPAVAGPIPGERPRKERTIWGLDDKQSFELERIEPPEPRERKRSKGGGGGGTPRRHPDPDVRKRTDEAGMNLAMKHEKDDHLYPTDVSTQHQRLSRGEGPGCDIHSFDADGELVRRVEVKSSLGEFSKLDFTATEWSRAQNEFTGKSFYLYRISKLDADRYPDGPELLRVEDPYGKGLEALPSGYVITVDPRKGELIKLSPVDESSDENG